MAGKSAVISQLSKIFWQFFATHFFMGVQRYMPIYFYQNNSELFRKPFDFFIFFKRSSRYRKWIAKIGTDSFPTNFSPPFLFTFASQSTNNFQRSDFFFFKCGAQRYGHDLSYPRILLEKPLLGFRRLAQYGLSMIIFPALLQNNPAHNLPQSKTIRVAVLQNLPPWNSLLLKFAQILKPIIYCDPLSTW